jgi:hypothetical protein
MRARNAGVLYPLLALALAACAPGEPQKAAADRPVALRLTNAGAEPLRCRLMFGHWVDRDLGRLAPGAAVELAILQQAADGALFVPRDDGARRMMIETIRCAGKGDWLAGFGQVDLAPARRARPASIAAACAAPAGPGRVTCPPVRLTP